MARYTIGKEYVFIRVVTSGFMIHCPWEDTLERIEIVKLRCVSEHDVPVEYSDTRSTGYIFVDDATGDEWYNQYPCASFGQLDDSSNWKAINTNENAGYEIFTDARYVIDGISMDCAEGDCGYAFKNVEAGEAARMLNSMMEWRMDIIESIFNEVGMVVTLGVGGFSRRDGGFWCLPYMTARFEN